jgi:hypothetical protein
LTIATDDAATHSTAAEERKTTEHLAFTDVVADRPRPADAIREVLVVRHAAFRY